MPHSPVTVVIYPDLSREDLKNYRDSIAKIEERNCNGGDIGEVSREAIFIARMLLEHVKFIEDKLEAKINVHNRDLREKAKEYDKLKNELMERSNEYDKLKSEYDAYKSKMAVEHPYLADAEPENENNDSKDQKSANPRKRDRENDDLADKTDEKRVCVVDPSGTESVATEQEADVDELERG